MFRDGVWHLVEDKVDIRALEVRADKHDDAPIMSITSFTRPADDPEPEPDSDREEAEPIPSSEERLRQEAASKQHQFTHRPKNPFCKVCQKAKMLAPQARKKGGSTTIHSKKFGDHITIDHIITKDLRDHGFEGEKVAFVVKDVYSKFRYVYPSETKSSEQCTSDLQHFLKVEDKVGIVYSDNAPELEAAVKQLGVRHNTSRAYVNENKAVIEREIRTILEGTRSNLTQANMPDHVWPLAAQHHAMALNISKRLDVEKIPWEDRFGDSFDGLVVPFGAKVIYWNNPKQNATGSSKFAPTGEEGIFLGYHVQPGFIFKKEYLVTPVKGAREAIQDSNFKILRVKRMEFPDGDFVYPLQNDESQDPPPNLDDQNCFSQTEDKLPDDLDDEEHKDLFEMLGIGEGEASTPRGEAVSDLLKSNSCLFMTLRSCLAGSLAHQVSTGMALDSCGTRKALSDLLIFPLSSGTCTQLSSVRKTLHAISARLN